MITKERLNELIEKGAMIYSKYRSLCLKNFKEKSDCGMYKREVFFHNNILYYIYVGDENYTNMFKLEDLYETEEDANFALRYKRVPHTVYLDLPTWEEFLKDDEFGFLDNDGFNWDIYYDGETISLANGYKHYNYEYNKNGYLKACEICRKLFLGEKVEEV